MEIVINKKEIGALEWKLIGSSIKPQTVYYIACIQNLT